MRTVKVLFPIVFGLTIAFGFILGIAQASGATSLPLAVVESNHPQLPKFTDSATIYVDADASSPTHDGTSWTNAYTNVQDALAVAVSDDQIWVAEGVYYPDEGSGQTNDDRTSTFSMKSGVAIYGGFDPSWSVDEFAERDWKTYATVLSGDIDKNDTNADGNFIAENASAILGNNTYHVIYNSGVNETARMDGFTITAGQANGGWPASAGGGMYNTSSSPILTNLIFIGNWATFGGGMYNYNNSAANIASVIFSGNVADSSGGGLKNSSSNASLINVVFSGNSADHGGGMSTGSSSMSLTNVTFSNNSATFSAGGIDATVWTDIYTLTNTILWGNTAPSGSQIARGTNTTIYYRNCDVQGSGGSDSWDTLLGIDLGNNIDADPLFARNPDDGGDGWGDENDDYGDLHLRTGSPALDSGANSGCPANDLDGTPRPMNAICDMGAFELGYQLALFNTTSDSTPQVGQIITFTLVVKNTGLDTVGGLLLENLSAGLNFLGPIAMEPPDAGLQGSAPPILASSLVISNGQQVTVTFPVTVSYGLAAGTQMVSTALVSSTEVITPVFARLALTVSNTPPDAADDRGTGFITGKESAFTTISVLTNDSDPNGDTITFVNFDYSGTLGLINYLGDGTFRYYPDNKFDYLMPWETATDTFTYTISDSQGSTDTATVTITINGMQDGHFIYLPLVLK